MLNVLIFFLCKDIFLSSYLYFNRQGNNSTSIVSYKLIKYSESNFDKLFIDGNNDELLLYDLTRMKLIDSKEYKKIEKLNLNDTITLVFKSGFFCTKHSPEFVNK